MVRRRVLIPRGKPSEFSEDRREWRHFEWVFRNWFGFFSDAAEEWLDEASSAVVELGETVPERRETDKALYMSLAVVCRNDALDVVKTVTRKRGFESFVRSTGHGDVVARVLESTGVRLRDHAQVGESDCQFFRKRLVSCSVRG